VSFAETCAAIAKTSGKLEKVRLLADYLRGLDDESLRCASIWFTGLPFAASENKVLQLGWALLRDALCAVGQVDETAFHQVYLRHSDLGETAYDILLPRPRAVSVLTLGAIDALFHQLHATRGPLAKRPLLIRGLEHCTALEGKFLVKIITSDLRIGLKEGLVEEGIGRAFEVSADEVRQANLLLGNIGRTALLARAHQLATAGVTPFRPVKFMLASPEQTAGGIWERMQERTSARASRRPGSAAEIEEPVQPVWIEDKYDGIRCQLHKVDERVELYSRDLKEMTKTFFDLAGAARRLPANCILDGEILAMRDEQVLPFAELQKRLGRREDDLFLGEEIPIQFVAFDLLWLNGESFLNRPLRERRRALEEIKSWPAAFRLARITQASSAAEIEAAFAAARSRRNEGLMVKDPNSVYSPGRRGLAWLKLKKPLATLDCVVVGAEYGHGKRKAVLSDYTFAVRDDETGELRTIGKAYSGLTDLEIARLTEHFLSRVIRQHGRYHEVEPDTVLEIAFDKIQPSPRHSSGLAMRFPRIVRIRTDKTPADIDTVATARRLARPEGG
jgi:DNA ligase-1